jgi:outer membrane immunogenic protein
MRFDITLAVLAATALVAGSLGSQAADLPARAPVYKAPVTAAPSWTGFYVGANVGGGWGSRGVDYSANDPASVFLFGAATAQGQPPHASFTSSGALGGLQLGYNWQLNHNWLVGIETDFDWSGIKGSGSSGGIIQAVAPFSATVDEHIKWFGTTRARLGYLPSPNLLAFITGGFAYGRVEQTGSYHNDSTFNLATTFNGVSQFCAINATCFAGSSSRVATGWTLGGGFEYAVWQNWTLKGEYLYVSLDGKPLTETATGVTAGGPTPSTFNANFGRTNLNVVRVGVNHRF